MARRQPPFEWSATTGPFFGASRVAGGGSSDLLMKRFTANVGRRYDFAVVYGLPLLTAQRSPYFIRVFHGAKQASVIPRTKISRLLLALFYA